jgi:Flp pilus assembly protein TadG
MLKTAHARGEGFFKRAKRHKLWTSCAGNPGAQIVELAITLPVLVGLWYGIFDFGHAFNLKQKLSDVTRQAARFASTQSTSDLTSVAPGSSDPQSILDVRNLVSAYLKSNNVSDCDLATTVAPASTNYTWVFTATGCASGNLVLTINRGKIIAVGSGSTAVTLEGTQVDLTYPYQWQFSRVVKLIAPNATFSGPAQIPSTAIMPNIS